jgi:hypothetical protein
MLLRGDTLRVALFTVTATAVLGLLLGSLLRRFGSPLGFWISFAAQTLLRLTVGVLFAISPVVAAAKGGVLFIAIAVVFATLAVWSFAISGFIIWGIRRFGVPNDV